MGQLEEMKNFVRVVEAGSISKAAEQLNIAKSGVSRRLSDLESRLGVLLLNRTTRRSSLTEAGQLFFERSRSLIEDVAELNASAAEQHALLQGQIRLAVPLSFGLEHLSPALDEFSRLHPQLYLNIDFSDHQIDLIEQGIDLAIRIADLQDSDLQARRLCPIRIQFCASPDYLQAFGTPESPQDLQNHKLLWFDGVHGSSLRLSGPDGKLYAIQSKPSMLANNGDFLRNMAVAGHGIVMLPSFIVWQQVATGELLQVMHEYYPQQRSAYAVYPRNRYLSRRVRLLIDFLAERFGENPYWDQFNLPLIH